MQAWLKLELIKRIGGGRLGKDSRYDITPMRGYLASVAAALPPEWGEVNAAPIEVPPAAAPRKEKAQPKPDAPAIVSADLAARIQKWQTDFKAAVPEHREDTVGMAVNFLKKRKFGAAEFDHLDKTFAAYAKYRKQVRTEPMKAIEFVQRWAAGKINYNGTDFKSDVSQPVTDFASRFLEAIDSGIAEAAEQIDTDPLLKRITDNYKGRIAVLKDFLGNEIHIGD